MNMNEIFDPENSSSIGFQCVENLSKNISGYTKSLILPEQQISHTLVLTPIKQEFCYTVGILNYFFYANIHISDIYCSPGSLLPVFLYLISNHKNISIVRNFFLKKTSLEIVNSVSKIREFLHSIVSDDEICEIFRNKKVRIIEDNSIFSLNSINDPVEFICSEFEKQSPSDKPNVCCFVNSSVFESMSSFFHYSPPDTITIQSKKTSNTNMSDVINFDEVLTISGIMEADASLKASKQKNKFQFVRSTFCFVTFIIFANIFRKMFKKYFISRLSPIFSYESIKKLFGLLTK